MYLQSIIKKNIFLQSVLNGISQIMLQENIITGVLFLVGVSVGSLKLGVGLLAGSVIGNLTALVLKFNTEKIKQGLFGFSSALVGVAVLLFFKINLVSIGFLIIGAIVSSIIQNEFMKRNIPVFTFPFVLITWIIYFTIKKIDANILSQTNSILLNDIDKYFFIIRGFGQVIFQDNIIIGIIFIIAVFISSSVAAIYGIIGAAISGILSYYFVPLNDISLGLMSYNAVLCAITFSNKKIIESVWALIAVILSIIFTILMMKNNLMALTFPFVISSCIVLYLKNKLTQIKVY
jgi:urea transporter